MDTQLFWFTGQPGAGKTEIGKLLEEELSNRQSFGAKKVVRIDGDDIRLLYDNRDYSEAGRRANVEFVQKLCQFLIKNDITVIVCMVSPFADQRCAMRAMFKAKEIYVRCNEDRGRESFHVDYYEPPMDSWSSNVIEIDTTGKTVEQSFEELWKKL